MSIFYLKRGGVNLNKMWKKIKLRAEKKNCFLFLVERVFLNSFNNTWVLWRKLNLLLSDFSTLFLILNQFHYKKNSKKLWNHHQFGLLEEKQNQEKVDRERKQTKFFEFILFLISLFKCKLVRCEILLAVDRPLFLWWN